MQEKFPQLLNPLNHVSEAPQNKLKGVLTSAATSEVLPGAVNELSSDWLQIHDSMAAFTFTKEV